MVEFETLGILACPLCGGRLLNADDGLICSADGADFPMHPSGLLDLRPPDGRAAADSFAAQYRAGRLADGWQPLSTEVACALPDGDPPGFTPLYWTVRRESWAVLTRLLGEFEPVPLTIADLGAGFPWLSHRLASLGHAVLAVDLSPDADFGLGAARLFPTAAQRGAPTGLSWRPGGFLPALGDLERPPLARATYDVVICNASLHYAHDLRAAVARLAQTLRSTGAFVVVDSPIVTAARPGRDAGRGLSRASVEDALRDAGLTVAWHPVPRGWLWQRHQLKNWLLRRPGFEFPIVVGTRASAP